MFKSMNHFAQNLFNSILDESSSSDTKYLIFCKGDSISETAIQRYKILPQHIQVSIHVVNIINPTNKVDHNFDVKKNYLIKQLVNFKGCYF